MRTSFARLNTTPNIRNLKPLKWRGGYLRYERNLQGSRVGFGYGHSASKSILGLEYGVILSPGTTRAVDYGVEINGLFTLGLLGVYIRESVVLDDDLRWQTDVGLRLQISISEIKLQDYEIEVVDELH